MEVKIDNAQLKAVSRRLDKFSKNVANKSIMNHMALVVKNKILLRTNSGVDVNKKPFEDYNADYADEKGKTIVNLTDTVEMLNSITQKALSSTKAKVFFTSKEQATKALRHNNGIGNLPKRFFFGVNEKDESDLVGDYQKAVNKAIKEFKQ